jgi:16S rRNA (adenine1518-N6/adenine1519-N6)-dimethyltransferase
MIRPTDPAERLRELGLRARKGLSQSFLADRQVANAIVAAAHPSLQGDVLEVGPGLGVLTERLVQRARRVVAVELDQRLAAELEQAIEAPNLTVVQSDILAVDPASYFDEPYLVVANLPYHITSPALRHLLAAGPPYAKRLVVMVQREVADRIAAAPGQLSALAVSIQAQARVRVVRQVPAAAFHPRPKVDSTVIGLDPLSPEKRAVPYEAQEAFVAFLHAGFTQPRKQLANSLAQGLGEPKADVTAFLTENGIAAQRRPQELTVAEWAALFNARQSG